MSKIDITHSFQQRDTRTCGSPVYKPEREVEKVERGLSMQFDFERYYYEVSDD